MRFKKNQLEKLLVNKTFIQEAKVLYDTMKESSTFDLSLKDRAFFYVTCRNNALQHLHVDIITFDTAYKIYENNKFDEEHGDHHCNAYHSHV